MVANFHTHTTFCDGKNTPEEIVLSAIDKGFSSIGFSGHGYTPYDLRYCMKDTEGYISEICRLKEKYKSKIQIYLGVEEDAFSPVDRSKFDYIIGSSHYYIKDGAYLPIDSTFEHFKKCLVAFDYDVLEMAEVYYSAFCGYIKERRPDIIGHFDLITKFDELDTPLFKDNREYEKIVEGYIREAIKADCIFEVNTGAITRGIRSTVYPAENLLHILKNEGAKIILGSDSHQAETIDGCFAETKKYLYDIGFRHLCTLFDGRFTQVKI